MKQIGQILKPVRSGLPPLRGKAAISNIVNNDNKEIPNYDINDKFHKKENPYALDRSKFIPNTRESQLAEEIATELNDLDNFACWYRKVKELGPERMMTARASVRNDITEKAKTKYPVRNRAKYFMWKLKKGKY